MSRTRADPVERECLRPREGSGRSSAKSFDAEGLNPLLSAPGTQSRNTRAPKTGGQDVNSPVTQADFSRVIDTAALGDEGETFRFVANDFERASIANWLSLVALKRLEATVEAVPVADGGIRLRAAFEADVIQSCVITLEPVPTCLQEAFELLYLPEIPRQNSAKNGESTVDVDLEAEQPELLVGDEIDMGAVISEHLVLALDPYPRKPGAALEPNRAGADGAEHPFAALQKLRADR